MKKESHLDLKVLLEFVPSDTVRAWERANNSSNLESLLCERNDLEGRRTKMRSSLFHKPLFQTMLVGLVYASFVFSVYLNNDLDGVLVSALILLVVLVLLDKKLFPMLKCQLAEVEQQILSIDAINSKFYSDLHALSGSSSGKGLYARMLTPEAVSGALIQLAVVKLKAEAGVVKARTNLAVPNQTVRDMINGVDDLDRVLLDRFRMATEGFPGLVTLTRQEAFARAREIIQSEEVKKT